MHKTKGRVNTRLDGDLWYTQLQEESTRKNSFSEWRDKRRAELAARESQSS